MFDASALALLDAALRGTLLAALALLAAVLLRDRPRLPAARAAVAMCAGLCVQVVSSTPLFEARAPMLWQAPSIAVSVGNVVLFWIFAQAMFDDDFEWRPVHAAAWLAVALLSGFNCVVGPGHALAPVTFGLQRAVPLLFAVLAGIAAASQWRADLVEKRRRLRAFILATGIFYTLAMLVARLGSPQGRLSDSMATFDVAVLLLIVLPAVWRTVQVGGSELFPTETRPARGLAGRLSADVAAQAVASGTARSALVANGDEAQHDDRAEHVTALAHADATAVATAAPDSAHTTPTHGAGPALPPPDPAEERLAGALQRLMAAERAYRTEDLTVARLAERLAVPEYRLRRLVNQRLGHRNFNAFVNAFRLDEARTVLADPARRELPVLTIALDAGFQSIGPFNRAFKAATGLTPTEFRREMLADS